MAQYIWLIGMAAPWAAGLLAFRRHRRTLAFGEAVVLGSRLPAWVNATERFALLVLWAVMTLVLLKAFTDLHRVAHGDAGTVRPGTAASIVMALASFLAPAVPALLLVTLAARLTPGLRGIHARAAEGLASQSLHKLALALAAVCLATTPLAIAEGIAGALEPWAR